MLTQFYIRNYRSILELNLDFNYAEGKAPNSYNDHEDLAFLQGAQKHRLVPCMGFVGANASGKSNILLAFGCLKAFVTGATTIQHIYEPNLLHRKFIDTTFKVSFVKGNDYFVYAITFNGDAIAEEALTKNGNTIFSIRMMDVDISLSITSPAYSKEKLADILRVECSDGKGRQYKPFLYCINSSYPGLHQDFKAAGSFFAHLYFLSNEHKIELPIAVELLAKALSVDTQTALIKITDMIRRLDIDIESLEIDKKEITETDLVQSGTVVHFNVITGVRHAFNAVSTHKDIDGKLVLFSFAKNESAGTQRLAGILSLVLLALETGGLLIVDELECSLHPLLTREIIKLFKRRMENSQGAQLVFSTHNTDILENTRLRISEIAMVRKTLADGSIVSRLSDLRNQGEDIRNITNFQRNYLDGHYSGVPHPAL